MPRNSLLVVASILIGLSLASCSKKGSSASPSANLGSNSGPNNGPGNGPVSCPIQNGSGTEIAGFCQLVSCDPNFSSFANQCFANTRACQVQNGTGSQDFANGNYGSCHLTQCNSGYQLNQSNSACNYVLQNKWLPVPAGATTPATVAGSAGLDSPIVWTGSNLLLWGAAFNPKNGTLLPVSGSFDPKNHVWTAISSTGAPATRRGHSVVWTGAKMIVWGGDGSAFYNDGAAYDPKTDSWKAISSVGAPTARDGHVAVWTGASMIVWGGTDPKTALELNNGGIYDPANDTWAALGTTGAPALTGSSAVWTGSKMLVFGGIDATPGAVNDVWSFEPTGQTWTKVAIAGTAPTARASSCAVWTGSKLVMWSGLKTTPASGGGVTVSPLSDGAAFDPLTATWSVISATGAPSPRIGYGCAWTGNQMFVWGGSTLNPDESTTSLSDGGIYY